MTKYETTINLGDLYRHYQDGKLTIQELGNELACRLKNNRYAPDLHRQISALENLNDELSFLRIRSDLYRFGGTGRIWFDPRS
jgi:hypothetical protein